MSIISKTLAPALASRYFAGVWEAYLPQSLLWRLDRPLLPPKRANPSFQRPDPSDFPYIEQKPSWSWASATGVLSQYIPIAGDHIPLIVMKEISVKIRGGGPFGQIKHAFIVLEAKIFSLGALGPLSRQLNMRNAEAEGIEPYWLQVDAPLCSETMVYILPLLHCAQGNYGFLLESAGPSLQAG
ncbi:uncharacterized protein BDW70DRAFT_164152 [Aspergillus foveolatus]|uniref:uncharacterized protein n=1 Tax=Aspergillus foveolatus TaxID=210207 RepID=UPI003CCD3E1A